MEKVYLAALAAVSGLGIVRVKRLLRYFGSAQAIWQANGEEIFLSGAVESALAEAIVVYRDKVDIELLAELWQKQSINVCAFDDEDYPQMLKNIHMPPIVLFYKGCLSVAAGICIAMVGARRATAYGKNVADLIARDIASAGGIVVSGAAKGIDTASHLGALSVENGKTIAVLGCGVDVVYPSENRKLLAEIAERGVVVSEYLPGTSPMPVFFPLRNRIISGLARGTVVVEAAERSGSLITADFALEQGRDVFAVPGSIFAATYKGTHSLLQQGAKLVKCANDILEEYGEVAEIKEKNLPAMSDEEKVVYGKLSVETPKSIEEIAMKAGLVVQNVAVTLLHLQIKGLVWEEAGKRYIKTGR